MKVFKKFGSGFKAFYRAFKHNDLDGRDEADAHPISTITGLEQALNDKQDELIAGENIIIEDNVISASGGGLPTLPLDQLGVQGIAAFGASPAFQQSAFGAKLCLPRALTNTVERQPTLSSADGASASHNSSTAWRALNGAFGTGNRWESTTALPVWWQYVWDAPVTAQVLLWHGARFPRAGSVSLRIGGTWTKLKDFDTDDYVAYDTAPGLQQGDYPIGITAYDEPAAVQRGRYILTLPHKVTFDGLRIDITKHWGTDSWIEDVRVLDGDVTWRKMFGVKQAADKQYGKFWDEDLQQMVTVNQSFVARWRHLTQVTAASVSPIVPGTLYWLLRTADKTDLILPNRGTVMLGDYAPKFAVYNDTTRTDHRIWNNDLSAVLLSYNGVKLARYTSRVAIPPYHFAVCTRVYPGTTSATELWHVDIVSQRYTPATTGDWDSPQPTTIAAALDQLATRIKALE